MKRILLFSSLTLIAIVAIIVKAPKWWATHERHQKDRQILIQSPTLSHIADSLTTPHIQTVNDLYDHADELQFKSAPNPSRLLKHMQASNPAEAPNSIPLKIISYNVALLDAELLGFIDYKQTPLLNERRGTLPSLILNRHDDIIFLQEIWRDEDVRNFTHEAISQGYRVFNGDRNSYNDGIMTLVKASRIDEHRPIHFESEAYDAQDPLEYFPGPQIKRGFHVVDLELNEIGKVHLYNTHTLAWPQQWFIRMQQVREMGLHAAHRNWKHYDLVFMGGDMNSGPFYSKDTWTLKDGSTQNGWWKNSLAYPLLLHYGNLEDLVVMGRTAENADIDLRSNASVTATDANELYRLQYEGTEYPARIDQLLASDPQKRIHVVKSEIIFTDKVDFGHGVIIEPSDHYGVFVDLKVSPPT